MYIHIQGVQALLAFIPKPYCQLRLGIRTHVPKAGEKETLGKATNGNRNAKQKVKCMIKYMS